MIPRWYRTRWFWAGLLGLILMIGAWVGSFADGKGHVWNWTNSRFYCYFSHGAGWIGGGAGKSVCIRYTRVTSTGGRTHTAIAPSGWRHSVWHLATRKDAPWLPPVQFKIEQGKGSLWSHYSVWITAWSIVWLVPLLCRFFPRRIRPPRFPGAPRRWFTSPYLWAGLPGFTLLIALWLDSTTHRSYANWKWSRGYKVEPNYLGFGVESNRGQAAIWAGRAFEGMFFRNTKAGLFHERKPSTGGFFLPDVRTKKGARSFKTSYLTITGIYLLLWTSTAAIWQYRQSRLRRSLRSGTTSSFRQGKG